MPSRRSTPNASATAAAEAAADAFTEQYAASLGAFDLPESAGYAAADGEFTGRFLVLMPEDSAAGASAMLGNLAGLSVASSRDFLEGGAGVQSLGGAEALVFPELNVAVVNAAPDKAQALMAAAGAESAPGMIMEPERFVYPIADLGYWEGYRNGVADASRRAERSGGGAGAPGEFARDPYDGADFGPSGDPAAAERLNLTWGLLAIGMGDSTPGGAAIKVAVLDTGLDLNHPDFRTSAITPLSFVSGEDAQDVLGHGTHCIGTACGPKILTGGGTPRYGVAWQSEIIVGKVFDRVTRRAPDARILAGIAEAVRRGCAVVSMSLGAPVQPGQPFNQVMEQAASRALARGTLVIAAAGNDSRRPGDVRPVSHPANCPSIMSVAAVNRRMRVASFSNGGLNPTGGKVDICGPGVDVLSAWPLPTRYRSIDGTSMATPHVAGCAALHAQASGLRGGALWARLVATARALPLPASDIGAGLVQVPR